MVAERATTGDSGVVRVVVLSDHVGEQVDELWRVYERALFDVDIWRTRQRDALRQATLARRAAPWWQRLPLTAGTEEAQARYRAEAAERAAEEAESRRDQADADLAPYEAGQAGEDTVAGLLAALPDAWTLVRGYRNRRGETDLLVVGPGGVWAIEVKNYNARLFVEGPKWWLERLDRRGIPTAHTWATDASGRSWARQVLDVADDLVAWLNRRGHPAHVRTAVMLVNPNATIGRLRYPEVDLVGTSADRLIQAIRTGPSGYGPSECRAILGAVIEHHRTVNGGDLRAGG